jgi:hypothetical protein
MAIIRLVHHTDLGYPPVTKRLAPTLPSDIVAMADDGVTVVTFRPLLRRRPTRIAKRLTAADRFSWIEGDRLLLYGVETDSPLAPLILWDVVHAAAIDTTISILGNGGDTSYLQRDYFKDSLRLVEQSSGKLVFRKTGEFLAEQEHGLDAWTFGIPVGPEDATLLNAAVKRILELEIPQKEILLCGRPAANFLYFDHVRIVGEEITAPPVKICEKKNRLAQEAAHPNLCIIHDRVFLPRDFYQAAKKFGDCYPFTALQSLYFDDKCNLVPRRYSDAGVSNRVRGQSVLGLMRDNDINNPSVFSPSVFAITEFGGFYPASALRYTPNVYATGSLYICKRAVWLKYPQNENLHWIEFEDLEHGFRASDAGIPTRINPHTLTQSMISRPLLGRVIGGFVENMRGKAKLYRPWTEPFPIPRKPVLKVSKDAALASMNQFARKYVPPEIFSEIGVASVQRMDNRIFAMINMVSRAKVPMQVTSLRTFLTDFEKWAVFDQMAYNWYEHAAHKLLVEREPTSAVLVRSNEAVINHAALRPKGKIFYDTLDDYFLPRFSLVPLGSLCSGIYLFFKRKHVCYIKGGPLAYYRAIANSTPYVDYGK